MRVSTEEAALMVAATNLTKKVEAIEAELVAAQAAKDRATPQCRECSTPLPSEHSLRALEAQGVPLSDAIAGMREDGLEVLVAWSLGFCNSRCEAKHQQRKEQSDAAGMEMARAAMKRVAALRVVKEES